jgi:hypothetical protein
LLQYWSRCEELINQVGAHRMPKLQPETEHDTKAMRKFVIKIPYQHDIAWWFREFERPSRQGRWLVQEYRRDPTAYCQCEVHKVRLPT